MVIAFTAYSGNSLRWKIRVQTKKFTFVAKPVIA
jgi:hypothetical protein